jgi:membrane associated rhomboid family serine protease
MLLPISHERMTVRRLPVVTVTIIVITMALHALMGLLAPAQEDRVVEAILEAQSMYATRPALGICRPLKPFLNGPLAGGSAMSGTLAQLRGSAPSEDLTERYAAACKDLDKAVAALPSQRFGYVPARANFFGLFTYMFVHADWWHVIGNMWFLFLCGLALEDRWGRLAFAAYYLVAGVVAAGVHHLMLPESTAGLIGASGAVAGAMGAFVVLFARTKIRFVGFLGFRLLTFFAPAYVMLPLWALVELLYGLITKSSGTAHWAHVGGFVFGLAVAVLFRVMGVDKRLDRAVEHAAVIGDDPRIDAARAMVTAGEVDQAIALLEGLLQEKPGSTHVLEALAEARRAKGPEAATTSRASSTNESATQSAPPRPSTRASVPRVELAPPPPPPKVEVPSVARMIANADPDAVPFFPPPPPKR